jgi:hypothetical protein
VVVGELFQVERGGDFRVVMADPGEGIDRPAPAQEDRGRGQDGTWERQENEEEEGADHGWAGETRAQLADNASNDKELDGTLTRIFYCNYKIYQPFLRFS